jgi:hypothetical protein
MSGADLRLAKEQRCVMPAAIEQIHDRVGHGRHIGLILAKAIDDCRHVGHQPTAIELKIIRSKPDIGSLALQYVKEPVR